MKQYKLGDRVQFFLDGETINYDIRHSHLCHNRRNDTIFTMLGMNNSQKLLFAEKIYGYTSDPSGSWPVYKSGDMGAANRIIQAVKVACDEYMGKPKPITHAPKHKNITRAVEGDYFYSLTQVDQYSRMVGTIVRVEEILKDGGSYWVVRYDSINGSIRRCTDGFPEEHFRYATHTEILASKYADEYKSLIGTNPTKSVNYEVQSKSKTDSSRHRSEAIKPRRGSIKVASSSGLVGHAIKAISRRGKFRSGQVRPSFLVATRD